jgi:hypothetical protein
MTWRTMKFASLERSAPPWPTATRRDVECGCGAVESLKDVYRSLYSHPGISDTSGCPS